MRPVHGLTTTASTTEAHVYGLTGAPTREGTSGTPVLASGFASTELPLYSSATLSRCASLIGMSSRGISGLGFKILQ